jgi:hypothetical protein
MSRYYEENGSEFNGYVQHFSKNRKQAEVLLHHEGWYGNVQGPPGGFHRYMRPRCFNITPEQPSIPDPREPEASSGGISETSEKK